VTIGCFRLQVSCTFILAEYYWTVRMMEAAAVVFPDVPVIVTV
jgi:hypothetical protein